MKEFSNIILRLTCFSLVLILASCREDLPEKRHAPPVRFKTGNPGIDFRCNHENFLKLDVKNIEKKLRSKDPEIRLEVFSLLSLFVLNQDLLDSPGISRSQKMLRLLGLFNKTLKELHEENGLNGPISEIFPLYRDTMLAGCQEGGLIGCRYLKFFGEDPLSRYFAKIFARDFSGGIRETFRFISLFWEWGDAPGRDSEVEEFVVSASMKLLKSYVYASEKSDGSLSLSVDHLTDIEKVSLRKYSDIITIVFSLSSGGSEKDGFTGISGELYSWLYSEDFAAIFGRRMRDTLLSCTIESLEKKDIWSAFSRRVKRNEGEPGSYTKVGEKILEVDSSILKNLDITFKNQIFTDRISNDLINFDIIRGIYNFDSDTQAMALWSASEKNIGSFLETLENYIQIQMIGLLLKTNKKMGSVFEKLGKEASGKLIDRAILQARSNLTPMWKDFFKRVWRLRSFFLNEINGGFKGSLDRRSRKRISEMERFFDQLNLNVKYLVTYPNLLMLGYYATKYEYVEQFHVFGKSVTINAENIMNDLMKGKVPPIFVFTDYEEDYQGLSELEIVYALYFAIKTNILKAYSVDPADWFEKLAKSYFADLRKKLRTLAEEFTRDISGNSNYRNFLRTCRVVEDYASGRINEKGFEIKMGISGVRNRAFMGRFSESDGGELANMVALIATHYDVPGRFDEALEVLRNDIRPRFERLVLIRNLFSGTRACSPDALKKMSSTLSEIAGMMDTVFDRIEEIEKNVSSCALEMSEREHQRKIELFQMEMDFIDNVHLALSALHTMDGDRHLPVRDLKARYDHPLWENSFFSHLDPEVSLLKAVNRLIIKELHYGDVFAVNGEYEKDYSVSGGIRRTRVGRYFFNYRIHDVLFRLAAYLRYGFDRTGLSFQPERLKFEFPHTMEEIHCIVGPYCISSLKNRIIFFNPPSKSQSYETVALAFKRIAAREFASRDSPSAVNWFFNIMGVNAHMKFLLRTKIAIYRSKYQLGTELFDVCDLTCQEKKISLMKKDAGKILLSSRKMLDQLRIKPVDREILSGLLNTPSYFGKLIDGPLYLFLSARASHEYMGIGDAAYGFLITPFLGIIKKDENDRLKKNSIEVDAIERTDFFWEAGKNQLFFKKSAEWLLFPVEEGAKALMDASLSRRISTHMMLVHAFEEAAGEMKGKENFPSVQFHLEYPVLEKPWYLSNSLKSQYYYDTRRFNQQTAFFFLPEVLKSSGLAKE